jgi:hypothetical protein
MGGQLIRVFAHAEEQKAGRFASPPSLVSFLACPPARRVRFGIVQENEMSAGPLCTVKFVAGKIH